MCTPQIPSSSDPTDLTRGHWHELADSTHRWRHFSVSHFTTNKYTVREIYTHIKTLHIVSLKLLSLEITLLLLQYYPRGLQWPLWLPQSLQSDPLVAFFGSAGKRGRAGCLSSPEGAAKPTHHKHHTVEPESCVCLCLCRMRGVKEKWVRASESTPAGYVLNRCQNLLPVQGLFSPG